MEYIDVSLVYERNTKFTNAYKFTLLLDGIQFVEKVNSIIYLVKKSTPRGIKMKYQINAPRPWMP